MGLYFKFSSKSVTVARGMNRSDETSINMAYVAARAPRDTVSSNSYRVSPAQPPVVSGVKDRIEDARSAAPSKAIASSLLSSSKTRAHVHA